MKLLSDYALLNNLEGAEGKTSVIFPVTIYGFEICSVTLRIEYGLMVGVWKYDAESKGEEVAGDWRKLHDDELCDVYSLHI
jgi:hypothetical protein